MLTDEYVLEHIRDILTCQRASNVALRWLLLHTRAAENGTLRQNVIGTMAKYGGDQLVMDLLLLTSRFEFHIKCIATRLLETKSDQWREYQRQGCERMDELCRCETVRNCMCEPFHKHCFTYDISQRTTSLARNRSPA